MPSFADLARITPLPLVDLRNIGPPIDGINVHVPAECFRNFAKNSACRQHYQQLGLAGKAGEFVQCPYGFASVSGLTNTSHVAFTCLIPHPRLGGPNERRLAKKLKSSKIDREGAARGLVVLRELEQRIADLEDASTKKYSVALHEIRKLNRTVKQSAERICVADKPVETHVVNAALVQIWKTAELMTQQFEVIDLLANESLTTLPLQATSNVYRIFDKCIRIYRSLGSERITLKSLVASGNCMIRACDKTFPIIPTVLIENALKYSMPETPITVEIGSEDSICQVSVMNYAKLTNPLTNDIFKKGFRVSSDSEGSGNGLYLAKLVAEQHGASLDVFSTSTQGVYQCFLVLRVPEV